MSKKFSKKELSIIGVMLYICEGTKLRKDKRSNKNVYYWVIEFTNSDFRVIKLFLKFLRQIIKIDESKLKGELFIYDDLDKQKIEKKWSKISGIPVERFNKTIIFKAKNGKYKPNLNGTFKIRYHSKESYIKLNSLIKKYLD